jgi:hypothetical protein
MRFSSRLPTIVVALLWCLAYVATPEALAYPQSASKPQSAEYQASASEIVIPGPLRSLLRMAGVSQKISEE